MKAKALLLPAIFLLSAGCGGGVGARTSDGIGESSAAEDAVPRRMKSSSLLFRDLAARGVTPETTAKLVFVGSEADFGPDVDAVVEDREAITKAWESIARSKPYGVWYASGYRRAEFFVGGEGKPAAVLLINASDACHLKDLKAVGPIKRYRCEGLHETAIKLLEKEYERRKGLE